MNGLQDRRGSSARGVYLVALGAALWGLDSVFIVPLLKALTSSQIVFIEHLLLVLYAVPVLWVTRQYLKNLTIRQWGAILFIAWGGSAIASILFTRAFLYGNASAILMLQKMQPIFAVVLAQWLLRERVTRWYPAYFVVALVGAYLLTFGASLPQGLTDIRLLGALLALGAAALWGGSTVMGRYLLAELPFETVTALRFIVALPLLFAFVWNSDWGVMAEHSMQPLVLANLLFQALLPSLVSLLLYYRGLRQTKASYATIAELSFPATGLLVNWLVLHQGISTGQLIGFVLIWLCVAQVARQDDNTAVRSASVA
jgi:drug/metabolite transporter (DMT)-like permease